VIGQRGKQKRPGSDSLQLQQKINTNRPAAIALGWATIALGWATIAQDERRPRSSAASASVH
jgi:hypothetical protein